MTEICSVPNTKKMAIHKGQEVRKIMDNLGFTVSAVSEGIKMNRGTLTSKLQNPNMDKVSIEKIGEFIEYDFSKVFGDYVGGQYDNLVMEPNEMNYSKPEPTMISIALDGTERTYDQVMQKLKVINQSLRKWNEISLNTES
jgi:hypothetical protein